MSLALAAFAAAGASAQSLQPGTYRGSNVDPSPANLALTWQHAYVVLPGAPPWQGVLSAMTAPAGKHPVAIFMPGSSGRGDWTDEFQLWLASLGVASISPDTFALPDRLEYASPLPVAVYERVHTLRSAELSNALAQARALPWVDPDKIVVIGSSEGSVAVARLGAAPGVVGRVIMSWSCEASYFVDGARTGVPKDAAVLTIVASRDPYFSPLNPWNAGHATTGSCAAALRYHAHAMNVVITADQHTIMNLPEAHDVIAPFLRRIGVAP